MKIKHAIKSFCCLLSGVVSVQQNFGKITGWDDIEPETADYYSCFLFKNGRHIPVPLMFSIYQPTITRIDGKIAWFKFDLQGVIIFCLGKIMKLKKIRKYLDQMDQDIIFRQICIIEG